MLYVYWLDFTYITFDHKEISTASTTDLQQNQHRVRSATEDCETIAEAEHHGAVPELRGMGQNERSSTHHSFCRRKTPIPLGTSRPSIPNMRDRLPSIATASAAKVFVVLITSKFSPASSVTLAVFSQAVRPKISRSCKTTTPWRRLGETTASHPRPLIPTRTVAVPPAPPGHHTRATAYAAEPVFCSRLGSSLEMGRYGAEDDSGAVKLCQLTVAPCFPL